MKRHLAIWLNWNSVSHVRILPTSTSNHILSRVARSINWLSKTEVINACMKTLNAKPFQLKIFTDNQLQLAFFLKRFMWSNEWKGLLIKRLQKRWVLFVGKNQALLMNNLPTFYLVLNLQTYLVCDNPNIFLHILPLIVLCTCLGPTWSYLALHLSYSSKFCLTKGEA